MMPQPPTHIEQILLRVAAIQQSIELPGLGQTSVAYAFAPADPASADCPFWYNELRGGQSDFFAAGRYLVEDNLRMILCVSRYEAEASLALNNQRAAQWRDIVFTTFALHLRLSAPETPGFSDLDFVVDAWISGWDRVRETIGSTEFSCLVFNLKVREGLNVTVSS